MLNNHRYSSFECGLTRNPSIQTFTINGNEIYIKHLGVGLSNGGTTDGGYYYSKSFNLVDSYHRARIVKIENTLYFIFLIFLYIYD